MSGSALFASAVNVCSQKGFDLKRIPIAGWNLLQFVSPEGRGRFPLCCVFPFLFSGFLDRSQYQASSIERARFRIEFQITPRSVLVTWLRLAPTPNIDLSCKYLLVRNEGMNRFGIP